MARHELPRLYELIDSVTCPIEPDFYFHNFDDLLTSSTYVKDIYLALERMLQKLDDTAWEHIKNEARQYLVTRNKDGRGWQQLFNVFNEARAYVYLLSIGCTEVRFIPRSDHQTPDIECLLASDRVLCEIKTISVSNIEVALRTDPTKVFSTKIRLNSGFLNNLRKTIQTAKQQILAFDKDPACLRLIYLNISFDDSLAIFKEAYFKQIDDELEQTPVEGVRLVICNDRTAYYKSLEMRAAHVHNIGDD